MGDIFNTEMLIYQPKANRNMKILFGKSTLRDPEMKRMLVKGLYEKNEIPRSFLVQFYF